MMFSPIGSTQAGFLNFGLDTVTVVVGEEKTAFCVNKDLLTQQSKFFGAAFHNQFREHVDGVIYLPNTQPVIFKVFLQWLYAQCMRVTTESVQSPIPVAISALDRTDKRQAAASAPQSVAKTHHVCSHTADMEDTFKSALDVWRNSPDGAAFDNDDFNLAIQERLLNEYIFADGHEIRQLRNDVISAISYYDYILDGRPLMKLAPKAYDCLPEESTWCQYLVKMTAKYWDPNDRNEGLESLCDLPPPFLAQVLMINTRRASGIYNPDELAPLRKAQEKPGEDMEFPLNDLCAFHEHDTIEEEEKCKADGLRGNVFVQNLLCACITSVRQEYNIAAAAAFAAGKTPAESVIPLPDIVETTRTTTVLMSQVEV